jgi:hypothetical protein
MFFSVSPARLPRLTHAADGPVSLMCPPLLLLLLGNVQHCTLFPPMYRISPVSLPPHSCLMSLNSPQTLGHMGPPLPRPLSLCPRWPGSLLYIRQGATLPIEYTLSFLKSRPLSGHMRQFEIYSGSFRGSPAPLPPLSSSSRLPPPLGCGFSACCAGSRPALRSEGLPPRRAHGWRRDSASNTHVHQSHTHYSQSSPPPTPTEAAGRRPFPLPVRTRSSRMAGHCCIAPCRAGFLSCLVWPSRRLCLGRYLP